MYQQTSGRGRGFLSAARPSMTAETNPGVTQVQQIAGRGRGFLFGNRAPTGSIPGLPGTTAASVPAPGPQSSVTAVTVPEPGPAVAAPEPGPSATALEPGPSAMAPELSATAVPVPVPEPKPAVASVTVPESVKAESEPSINSAVPVSTPPITTVREALKYGMYINDPV